MRRTLTKWMASLMWPLLLAASAHGASTPAGSLIDNRATATYTDQNNHPITLDSNVVRTVSQPSGSGTGTLSFVLAKDTSVQLLAGAQASLAHAITNTGGISGTFTLAAKNLASDDFDLSAVTVINDLNENGVADPGEPTIIFTDQVTIAAGDALHVVVTGLVPASATTGQHAQLQITATPITGEPPVSNTDTVTIATATLQLTKSASVTTAAPGDPITFHLGVQNSASVPAQGTPIVIDGATTTRVLIADNIPANSRLASALANGSATALYHLSGDAPQSYVSAAPTDLARVDGIAFALASIAPQATLQFDFSVKLLSNAAGVVRNTFRASTADTTTNSNEVDIAVSGAAPVISYFQDGSWATPITATGIGLPLFVQADASGCNLDPLVAETRTITLSSHLTGDVESFNGVESGLNTGIFQILPAVPTADASTHPVAAGDHIMEVLHGDVLSASIQGCGANAANATILIDPAGVVFDSHSDATVPGAQVSLIDVTGAGNGGQPGGPASVLQFDGATPAPSTVTTGADGRFQFPRVKPSTYQVSIVPPTAYSFPSKLTVAQLPADRHVDANASYGASFQIAANSPAVLVDVPLDPHPTGAALFVQKTVDRGTAQVGEFLDYAIEVKNLSTNTLPQVKVTDSLPLGLAYQRKTARLQGSPLADPQGGSGPALVFSVGDLAANADVKLSYRVYIGPGAAQHELINRAFASANGINSNTSSATVKVQDGLLSNRGVVVGKVFADCNRNGMQDPGEPGVPGVRLYLDDGSFVDTDGAGQYSLYGVSGRVHILKIDRLSVPSGMGFFSSSSRNAGDGASRFVDLMFGELAKADFALQGCSSQVLSLVAQRQKTLTNNEIGLAVTAQFTPQETERSTSELKGLSASGLLTQQTVAAAAPAPTTAIAPAAVEHGTQPVSASSDDDRIYAELDNTLGFLDLKDNDVLPYAQARVRVKGGLETHFQLWVNGNQISEKQVGKRVSVAGKQLAAWEFIGVNFQPGKNNVIVKQIDAFGNVRGEKSIDVIAPSSAGKLHIATLGGPYYADGKTPIQVEIKLTDASDVPVTVRTPLTLESDNGRWLVPDLDAKESGTQVFIEGGRGVFSLVPPAQPGKTSIKVSGGPIQNQLAVDVLPELRPLLAAGVVQYAFHFGNQAHSAIQSTSSDGFANELQMLSMSDDGAHASFFLKGKIKGSNLLTMEYDSDKTPERLFRDIQPDQYYPVYGDASIRGYDAQSTSKAYLRLDHGKTYVLYGDYLTSEAGTQVSLANYSRSQTGVKEHIELGALNLTGFTSYDVQHQVVEEINANGTSGPYTLKNPNGVENSEKVEILVRDRNQPSVILDIKSMSRFSDYEFEPFTGNLIFKEPIASLDSELNPQSIRVTYEVQEGGNRFWSGGAMGTMQLTRNLKVGGTYVEDRDPEDPNRLFGVNSQFQLDPKTTFTAEIAGTNHDSEGTGLGYRVEMQHDGTRLKGRAYFGRTANNFDNQTSILNKGRGEGGVKGSYQLTDKTRVVGEFIRSEDLLNNNTRDGGELGLEHKFGPVQATVGFRHAEETSSALAASTVTDTTTATDATIPTSATATNSLNTVLAKAVVQVPHFERFTASADFEQDIADANKQVAGLGASYQITAKSRIYFRQEVISSLGDVYSLNDNQRRNATLFGVEANAVKDTHVFSEYRIRDGISGREAEAAMGLRNTFKVRPGLALTAGVESIRAFDVVANNSFAVTSGLEYTASDRWKGSARLEWRNSATTSGFLQSASAAAKLSDSWTFLTRNVLSTDTSKGTTTGTHLQDRVQAGFAVRDFTENRWNAISMLEVRTDNDSTQPLTPVNNKSAIASIAANYQITAPATVSGRYAVKWSLDGQDGLTTSAATHLAGIRLTHDIGQRFDAGIAANTMFSPAMATRQNGYGAEVGTRVIQNLWFSVGYNLSGFRSDDLSGEDVTRRGAFVRLRFKFDESIFSGLSRGSH